MFENDLKLAWYKKWWGRLIIACIFIILVFLTAFGFYVYDLIKEVKKEPAEPKIKTTLINGNDFTLAVGYNNNYWLGSANPKITIVEFADFSCPYCQNSYPKIRELSIKHKNDIKIIFRDFPLKNDFSISLALAGRCAGEQGLFWPLHDKFFQNQNISQEEDIYRLAIQVGVDQEKFKDCLQNKKYLPQVQKDFTDGETLGLTGTPAWFINGYKIEGDIPITMWEEIINKLNK